MVTTSRLRREYPDLIVSTSGPRCDYSSTVPVLFPATSRISPTGRIALRVAPIARQAFRALAAVMYHYGYAFDETAGGTLNCRYIGGTTSTSLHAHGIAGDWNPSRNAYRRQVGPVQWGRQTDMPLAMVQAIERLRTVSGAVLIQWGGRWSNIKDPMHYELDCLRADLKTGVNLATLPAGSWARYLAFEAGTPTEGESMLSEMKGTKSEAVARHQRDLVTLGFNLGDWTPYASGFPKGADGFWGDDTIAADRAFEEAEGLPVKGNGNALTVDHARALANPGTATAVDNVARTAAKAAQTAADRANRTLDKVRSE